MSAYKTKQDVIEALESMFANPAISPLKMDMILSDLSDHIVELGVRLSAKSAAIKALAEKGEIDAE